MKKLILAIAIAALAAVGLTACANDAQIVSSNISQDADNFRINRRVVLYNGITGAYILNIEGLCSLAAGSSSKNSITVTCRTGPSDYKKHILGLGDNVTFFAEQLEPAKSSTYFYRVTFKPTSIVPDIELR